MAFNEQLRCPKEAPLYAIGIVFSAVVWLLMMVSVAGAVVGLFSLLFVLVGQAVFLAHVRGNGIRASQRQLPDLYARCVRAAERLGMPDVPEVYVMESGGILNAFATKMFSRKFVVIYSSLIDACEDPRQLEFVIGHELGHVAAGHLQRNKFLLPMFLVPWLGPAYSRACEYTADRAGYEVVSDPEASLRGLLVLAAGGRLAREIDIEAFMSQREETGSFWMAVRELVSSHPYLCKRVGALREIGAPGTVPRVDRTPFAYPFAPLLGFSVGGPSSLMLLMAIYIGFIASSASVLQKLNPAQNLASGRLPVPTLEAPDTDDETDVVTAVNKALKASRGDTKSAPATTPAKR